MPRAKLPRGRTRVATLHVQIPESGHPVYRLNDSTAATTDGDRIGATHFELIPGR